MTLDVPKDSRADITYAGGSCTKNDGKFSFSTSSQPFSQFAPHFTSKSGEPWESCAYEASNARYVITVTVPSQQQFKSSINVAQVAPNAFTRSFKVVCERGTMPCPSAGTDTVHYPLGDAPSPRATFGPVKQTGGPSGYNFVYCAPEGGICHVSSPRHALVTIAYGAKGHWAYKQNPKDGAYPCNNSVFTDPIDRAGKDCWVEDCVRP